MKKKLSDYIKIVDYKEEILLFNTVNCAMVSLKKSLIDLDLKIVDLNEEDIIQLQEMDFFITKEQALEIYKRVYDDYSQLVISIETNLSCNLACPYCYQNNKKSLMTINKETLDRLYDHIVSIIEKRRNISRLVIKVLGGEPTLVWEKSEHILSACYKYCKSKGIEFIVMVDTNCVDVYSLMSFEAYDFLILTVPLIEKQLHDEVRKTNKGQGTYDVIVANVNALLNGKKNLYVNLRYNVDHLNKDHFEKYIDDISTKIKDPKIYLNYIMNLAEGEYANKMSLRDFLHWQSTEALDILIRHNVKVTFTPQGVKNRCQCFANDSFKIFSDGTIGPCAMFFFKDRVSLYRINNAEKLPEYWHEVKTFDLMATDCASCSRLFMCNGAKYMPCIKAVCEDVCSQLNGEIDVCYEEYLPRYYECMLEGKQDLFISEKEQILR